MVSGTQESLYPSTTCYYHLRTNCPSSFWAPSLDCVCIHLLRRHIKAFSSPGLWDQGRAELRELFSEVENLLCDLRLHLFSSEPPISGLLCEHLDLAKALGPHCPHRCTVCNSFLGWAFVGLSHCSAWPIGGAQVSYVEGASRCTMTERMPRAFLFPGPSPGASSPVNSPCGIPCSRSSSQMLSLLGSLSWFLPVEEITGALNMRSEDLWWPPLQSTLVCMVPCEYSPRPTHILGAVHGGEPCACDVLFNLPQQPCKVVMIIILPFADFRDSEK